MGKPAVMAGFWGSHMGLIDLMLERDGNSWRIASHTSEARPIYRRDEDRSITPLVESDARPCSPRSQAEHEATLAYVARRGRPDGRAAALLFRAGGRRPVGADRVERADLVHRADDGRAPSTRACRSCRPPHRSRPVAAAARSTTPTCRPARSRSRTSPTSTSIPNTVRAVRITGAEVREWLERSAGMFNQITPGEADQVLLNPDFPSYNFDVIDGVTYQIDLSPALPLRQRRRGGEPRMRTASST